MIGNLRNGSLMSATANPYSSSVGKKILMALTGVILFGFVFVHMVGNLKIYQGQAKFDAYAHFLREVGYPALGHGQLLWIARIVLLGCVLVHIVAALQLTLTSWRARRTGYVRKDDLSFSYASRTMRWGGVTILAFVVFHVLHLTTGTVHPGFSLESPYLNVLTAFKLWPAALAYVFAMAPLCLHIYHGVWSATQSLSLQHPTITRWRRLVAGLAAGAIFVGNVSVPFSIWLGWVR
jgi:succinate dehydrogenase / fumarate reductase cytochrome b subunit